MRNQQKSDIIWLNLGVALISFAVLTVELSLIRVMDVILAPSTGYMVLTSAMFALGLGGIYLYLFPIKTQMVLPRLGRLALIFAITAPLVIPLFNALPFSIEITKENRVVQMLAWSGMYFSLIVPFMVVGLILSQVFLSYSKAINRLYFFDLLGAGIACLFFIPLIPFYGPGGLLFVASAAGLLASFCFYRPNNLFRYVVPLLAITALFIPLAVDGYIEFRGHANKRNNDLYIQQGKRVHVRWDPVSKLDVFRNVAINTLLFSLDGGQQGSWLRQFKGEFSSIKKTEDNGSFYMGRGAAIHYLLWKKGMNPEILLIGSSAGGDIKRALSFNAKHVDAVELVGSIINAERHKFRDYGGGWYSHPDVTAVIGEGRTYLRSTAKKYDVIQMFSSHTSSSVESGSGAVQTVYLQTIEAYMEYFQHLTEDGALQINHHIYPRMLTTAAQAWHRLGKKEFWRHALVIEPLVADTLPTMIIKMKPWTQQEMTLVLDYMNRGKKAQIDRPGSHHPSKKVFENNIYSTIIQFTKEQIEGVELKIGTYNQNGLPYDINVTLKGEKGEIVAHAVVKGDSVNDNEFVLASFDPVVNVKGKKFAIEVAAPEAKQENGFAVWLSNSNRPVLNAVPRSYLLAEMTAFNPLDPKENLVPQELLSSPFPWEKAEKIPWNISPVMDDSPYFSMIRKFNRPVQAGKQNVIDRNTAYLLNVRLRDGLPGDWLHLFVTAVVSVFFAFVFIVLPLIGTSLKKNTWQGMGRDIIYFSALGLGFILIEIVFIQLFKKLIGYPTHTFVVVICSLLISAGIGSALSKRFAKLVRGRMVFIFGTIIIYGILFALFYEPFFYAALGMSLAIRILVATVFIVPLGFFLGMPFPLGILGLSDKNDRAIPWAWAINGFFTVVGGLLAILMSVAMNFSFVLYCAFIVYGIALAVSRPYKGSKFAGP